MLTGRFTGRIIGAPAALARRTVGVLAISVLSISLLGSGAQPSWAQGAPGKLQIVRVYYPDLATAKQIIISFEASLLGTNYQESYHVLQASLEDIDRLEAVGLRVEHEPSYRTPSQRIPDYPCYETVEETFAAAAAMVAEHPDLADWTDIGDSWEKTVGVGGYDLMVLTLTNQAIGGAKPKFLLICAIHAREYTTAPLCLDFAANLLEGYGSDADATWLIDHHEIHLVLQANPDGRKFAEAGYYWRKNTNQNYCGPSSAFRGVDLNRNFPFGWGCCGGSSDWGCDNDYRGPLPASEPEVVSLVDYAQQIFSDQRGSGLNDAAPVDASGVVIDVHSYGELVLWPWGYTSAAAPNGAALQTLGRKLAFENGYWPQQAIGLYPTDGTTDDFFYGDLGLAAYTFELGTDFFESCASYEGSVRPGNMLSLLYAAKVARTPYMTPSGPDATSVSLSSSTALAGQNVTLNASLDDGRFSSANGLEPTQTVAGAEYYIDVPPWNGGTPLPMLAADGSFNTAVEVANAQLDTAAMSAGRHLIFVRGRDSAGHWGAFSAVFLTLQAPPMAPGLSVGARLVLGLLVLVTGSAWVFRSWMSSTHRPGSS